MKEMTPAAQQFILHWGEMGSCWGINRTVAQIHALLMISPAPLPADVICDRLEVARSNVSNCLRELQGWRLVRMVHIPGDRRDHFESQQDVWEMFRTIAQERKKREFDPTMARLAECLAEAEPGKDAALIAKVSELQGFFTSVSAWYDQFFALPTAVLRRTMKMGSALRMLFPGDKR
jgi:DNA-binding transcriptional regulator GbsR (MarR family)